MKTKLNKVVTTIMLLCMLMISSAVNAQSTAQKLDELISAYTDIKEFNGSVLIAGHGKIILQKGYGIKNASQNTLNNEHTIYSIASVTKTFTSTIILKLVELHKIALQDKLSKYYPGYPSGDSITIENLLTHTSGIYDYVHDDAFMFKAGSKPATEQKMLSLFENKPLEFAPGTDWSYSNSGYYLLGCIIQKVTGMSYQQVVARYVFTPLLMNNSGFDFVHLKSNDKSTGYYAEHGKDYVKKAPSMDSTITFAAGSIYSTVGDLYKWHQALQSHKIISKKSLKKAYTPFKHNYCYGWMIDSIYGKRVLSHSGGFWGYRSNFARVTDDDICIILLSNFEIPGLSAITNNILAVVYNKPYKIPVKKHAVEIAEDVLKRYTGTYEASARHLVIEVKIENGGLVTYPVKGPKSELAGTDSTHFFIKDQEDFEVSFVTDSDGVANEMLLNNNGIIISARRIK